MICPLKNLTNKYLSDNIEELIFSVKVKNIFLGWLHSTVLPKTDLINCILFFFTFG